MDKMRHVVRGWGGGEKEGEISGEMEIEEM